MSNLGSKSPLQHHPQARWIRIYILVTVGLFLLRVVIFAAHYGGIEHDSGWYLGVAKNLAHRGIYASYTNTIVREKKGVHPSIHNRLSVQDEDGFSYFPAGVTVGPGYVFPQALLIKIFGNGWWQYRLWPLITYAGLLAVLFHIVWFLGGIWALVVMQVWLWAIPQLTTTFAYEAFSEHTALFYLLISFLLFIKAWRRDGAYLYLFLTGFLLALAVLTKLLFGLTLLVFLCFALSDFLYSNLDIKRTCSRWTCVAVGFVLPIVLFELYRFESLYYRFGIEGWQAVNEDIRLTFLYHGSGIKAFRSLCWPFIEEKLRLWSDVGIRPFWLLWLIFLSSPAVIARSSRKGFRPLIMLIYGASMVNLLWFIGLSPLGWVRHAWHGLLLAMILISVVVGVLIHNRTSRLGKESYILLLLVFLIIGLSLQRDKIEINPFLDQETINKWKLTRRGNRGLPHAPVFSLADQQDTMAFFLENIRQEDRVYYEGWFLVAEMSPLVDRVFYPLARYYNNGFHNPEGGSSFLIFGPYQKGSSRMVPDWYLGAAISQLCSNVVFTNPSYTICRLEQTLKKD